MLIGVWNVYGIFVFSVQSSYRPKAALRNGGGGGGGLVAKSCLTLVIPWTIAHQPPLSMGFPRLRILELPIPYPGDLSNSGIEPVSPVLAGGFFTTEPPGKPR